MRDRLRATLALVVVGLLAAGCGTGGAEKGFTGTRLESPYQAADIALTDTAGRPYSLGADADKPLTLVFFGYTHCPDFCPLVLNNIAAAVNLLDAEDAKKVDVVLVTTDPTRDDEKTMRAYLDRYNKSFIGLTGDLDTIIKVGEPLHVYVNDGKKLADRGLRPGWPLDVHARPRRLAPRRHPVEPGDLGQGVRGRHPHPAHRRLTHD
ncbi:SCO family protein [Nocardioides convexus]|uniref:SCO family protein n=1 Tax=Nocardioides convexus TaxID=2712224 RepID=UPI0024189D9E|nr:SCO family protein [Nocardioides convexus]